MNKTKINKNANNIMWVEYWVQQAHPSVQLEISADPYGDKWKCEFELPLINKKVVSVSSTEVNAMLNAAKKAKKLIDQYMSEHPELKIEDDYWKKNWEIQEDENGNFIGLQRKSKIRRVEGMEFMKEFGVVRRAIEAAIDKVKRVLGTAVGLNVRVIDKTLLSENEDLAELQEDVWNDYAEKNNLDKTSLKWMMTKLEDDAAIFIFITGESPFIDKTKLN